MHALDGSSAATVGVGFLACVALSACGTKVEMNEAENGGLAYVGAFASFSSAQIEVRTACGLSEKNSYDPLRPNEPYLPAITETVHPFTCVEPEKDTQ